MRQANGNGAVPLGEKPTRAGAGDDASMDFAAFSMPFSCSSVSERPKQETSSVKWSADETGASPVSRAGRQRCASYRPSLLPVTPESVAGSNGGVGLTTKTRGYNIYI